MSGRAAWGDDPDRPGGGAGRADRLEVLRFGGGHYDGAVPVEDVRDDKAGGLAGAVGAERDRGDAVIAGEEMAGPAGSSGDEAPAPSCRVVRYRDAALLPA